MQDVIIPTRIFILGMILQPSLKSIHSQSRNAYVVGFDWLTVEDFTRIYFILTEMLGPETSI